MAVGRHPACAGAVRAHRRGRADAARFVSVGCFERVPYTSKRQALGVGGAKRLRRRRRRGGLENGRGLELDPRRASVRHRRAAPRSTARGRPRRWRPGRAAFLQPDSSNADDHALNAFGLILARRRRPRCAAWTRATRGPPVSPNAVAGPGSATSPPAPTIASAIASRRVRDAAPPMSSTSSLWNRPGAASARASARAAGAEGVGGHGPLLQVWQLGKRLRERLRAWPPISLLLRPVATPARTPSFGRPGRTRRMAETAAATSCAPSFPKPRSAMDRSASPGAASAQKIHRDDAVQRARRNRERARLRGCFLFFLLSKGPSFAPSANRASNERGSVRRIAFAIDSKRTASPPSWCAPGLPATETCVRLALPATRRRPRASPRRRIAGELVVAQVQALEGIRHGPGRSAAAIVPASSSRRRRRPERNGATNVFAFGIGNAPERFFLIDLSARRRLLLVSRAPPPAHVSRRRSRFRCSRAPSAYAAVRARGARQVHDARVPSTSFERRLIERS